MRPILQARNTNRNTSEEMLREARKTKFEMQTLLNSFQALCMAAFLALLVLVAAPLPTVSADILPLPGHPPAVLGL